MRRPITTEDNSSTRTVRHLLVMDVPVEEALPCANAHIARYHRLLALVQAERFFEPAGASVEARGQRVAGLGPLRTLGAGRFNPT